MIDVEKLAKHLGGHLNKTHVDQGTLEHLIQKFDIKSMIDIGCGPGGQVRLAEELGLDALGVDGDWSIIIDAPHTLHDFVKDGVFIPPHKFDLGWCVEFVEHVEQEYEANFMQALQYCKYVVLSPAPPGHKGHHHVNCQPAHYWVSRFREYGFSYDADITDKIKYEWSTMKKPFIQKNGLFFINERFDEED